jgi:hypothetical protein
MLMIDVEKIEMGMNGTNEKDVIEEEEIEIVEIIEESSPQQQPKEQTVKDSPDKKTTEVITSEPTSVQMQKTLSVPELPETQEESQEIEIPDTKWGRFANHWRKFSGFASFKD